uniref:Uncharacterized protein n=1 Tax=Acrobeloides nanus TaxID=290746 RepID=A0A914DDV1_9BILA
MCRELGFNTRKNGTFCDKDIAEMMNPCKTSRRHYSVVAAALDENTNLDESLKHIMNIALLSCNKAQSTKELTVDLNHYTAIFIRIPRVKDHSTNSTCDPSIVAPEQGSFQFYHLPLNATTKDIESLIVCSTTPPSENSLFTKDGTMISDSSITSNISSTNNITNKSSDTSEEPTKNLWWLFILIPIILIITIAVIIILCLRSTNRYVEKFLWPLKR